MYGVSCFTSLVLKTLSEGYVGNYKNLKNQVKVVGQQTGNKLTFSAAVTYRWIG